MEMPDGSLSLIVYIDKNGILRYNLPTSTHSFSSGNARFTS